MVTRPGKFNLGLVYALDAGSDNSEISVAAGRAMLTAKLSATAGWSDFKEIKVGSLSIDAGGPVVITLKPTKKPGEAVMNFSKLTFTPSN